MTDDYTVTYQPEATDQVLGLLVQVRELQESVVQLAETVKVMAQRIAEIEHLGRMWDDWVNTMMMEDTE